MRIGFRDILEKEGDGIVRRIGENIISNGQNASGDTIRSIRSDASDFALSVYANDSIETLETGISPAKSNSIPWYETSKNIFNWSISKGLPFRSEENRRAFSWNATDKQRSVGSLLFRSGGRSDVFTNEANRALQSISDTIGEELVNMQIIGQK